VDNFRGVGVDAVEPEAEAHHVVMALREVLYARCVADVAQYVVGEGLLKCVRSLAEQVVLLL